MAGSVSTPSPAPEPDPHPLRPGAEDEKRRQELAQQRRDLERRRRGRSSLVIDPTVRSAGGTGLRVPNG